MDITLKKGDEDVALKPIMSMTMVSHDRLRLMKFEVLGKS